MQSRQNKRFSSQAICKSLHAAGLISKAQAKELLKKENKVKSILVNQKIKNIDKRLSKKEQSDLVSFIEVNEYLKMDRKDTPSKKIDEDLIYKALARSWKISYEKIDQLKLELNLVTGTISESFAAKHLLLPLKIEAGKLVVATPDPFNYEAIKDVEMVSKLKVKTVVSPKFRYRKID